MAMCLSGYMGRCGYHAERGHASIRLKGAMCSVMLNGVMWISC